MVLLLAMMIPALLAAGCATKNMGDKLVKKAEKKPADIGLRLLAGDALMEEARYDEAVAQYDAAVKLVAKDKKKYGKYYFKAWNNKGVALYKLGEKSGKKEHFQESIKIFKKMLELKDKKKDSMLYSNIAHAYHGLGDFAESEKWFQQALQLNSSNENASKGYRILMDDMNKAAADKIKQAEREAADLAVKVDAAPQDVALRLKLADLLVDLDRMDQAMPHFQSIIENADPADPEHREALVTAHFFSKNYEQALSMLEEMAAEHPDDAMMYARMARCQHEMGQSEPALKNYEKALKLDPENPVAIKGLADLQKKLEQAAKDEPDAASEPEPDSE